MLRRPAFELARKFTCRGVRSTSTLADEATLGLISVSTPIPKGAAIECHDDVIGVQISTEGSSLVLAKLKGGSLSMAAASATWGGMVWRHERPFASTTIRMLPVQEAAKLWTLRLRVPGGSVSEAPTDISVAAGDLAILFPVPDAATGILPSTIASILGKLDSTPFLTLVRLRRQQLLESIAAARLIRHAAATERGEALAAADKGKVLQRYGSNVSAAADEVREHPTGRAMLLPCCTI